MGILGQIACHTLERNTFPEVFKQGFFLRFLKKKTRTRPKKCQREHKKKARECQETQKVPTKEPKSARGTRLEHRRLRRARCQGEKEPTTDQKNSRATSFHPENPWRGKLEEEEIIVLHSIVYYRGHGVR